jgi:PAS domain S-box-containing protein
LLASELTVTQGLEAEPAEPAMNLAERLLAEKAERYRSLFAYSPHGVFSLDLTGRLTDANEALLQLTGYSLSELLAINYHDIIHPDDIAAGETAFDAVVERVPQLLETRVLTAAGETREVKLTAVPVVVSGQVVGVHGIVEDITEANMMQRDLQAANAAKTLFLANVSHEVRTPLTMVIGATEMLLDTSLDPSQNQLADMVNRNSQRLLRLVNDILDFSRLEAGKISLMEGPYRLADVLDELLEWAQPRAAGRGLKLTSHLDDALPSTVHGDALRVSQIFSNLVDNALKFTDTGSVEIAVRRKTCAAPTSGGEVDQVEFAVTDSGVGIPPEHLESLFDSFTQADPTATRSHDGVGLGLAISRDLVDLMGGELDATSTPEVGTTFTVVLPLTEAAERAETTPV